MSSALDDKAAYFGGVDRRLRSDAVGLKLLAETVQRDLGDDTDGLIVAAAIYRAASACMAAAIEATKAELVALSLAVRIDPPAP
jgi:hypothetical protein